MLKCLESKNSNHVKSVSVRLQVHQPQSETKMNYKRQLSFFFLNKAFHTVAKLV